MGIFNWLSKKKDDTHYEVSDAEVSKQNMQAETKPNAENSEEKMKFMIVTADMFGTIRETIEKAFSQDDINERISTFENARQVCQQALHYVDEHEKKLNAELPIRDTFAGLMSICELDMLEVAGNIGLIDVRNNLHISINDRFKQIRSPKSRDYYAIAQAFMACIDDYQKVSYEQWKDVFSNFSKVSYKIEDVSKLSEFEQGIEKYRYARALYTMGIAYKNGLGVEKNREKAKEYLEKSLEHGYDCSDIISIL